LSKSCWLSLGRLDIRTRLGNLFGPATMVQPGDNLPLGGGLRIGLGHLRLEPARIQPG
jgi:hypothetical protein